MSESNQETRKKELALEILQHALGLDRYGVSSERGERRNHYVTGKGGLEWDAWMEHVEAGRAIRHEPREIFGGKNSYCFTVTDAGREYVREHSPKPPKLTRSQKRYLRYLEADSAWSFGEWLKRSPYADLRYES